MESDFLPESSSLRVIDGGRGLESALVLAVMVEGACLTYMGAGLRAS